MFTKTVLCLPWPAERCLSVLKYKTQSCVCRCQLGDALSQTMQCKAQFRVCCCQLRYIYIQTLRCETQSRVCCCQLRYIYIQTLRCETQFCACCCQLRYIYIQTLRCETQFCTCCCQVRGVCIQTVTCKNSALCLLLLAERCPHSDGVMVFATASAAVDRRTVTKTCLKRSIHSGLSYLCVTKSYTGHNGQCLGNSGEIITGTSKVPQGSLKEIRTIVRTRLSFRGTEETFRT